MLLRFLFLFYVVLKKNFMLPAAIENSKLKPALAIPTGHLITVANDTI